MEKFQLVWMGLIFFMLECYATRVIIVVHGTWAQKERWFMPSGSFYQALQRATEGTDSVIVPFLWPGGLGHDDRMHGACALAELIKSYKTDVEIIVIAHSHGSNVVLIASQILGVEEKYHGRIKSLFTLGVPVYKDTYYPDMRVIDALYNLFSFEDGVQTIFGFADRNFESHSCIANLCVTIEGFQPSHSLLHSDIVARWLLYIPTLLKSHKKGHQGMIHFSKTKLPYYEKKEFWRIYLDDALCKSITRTLFSEQQFYFDELVVQHDPKYH